ncbi:glycoside hydrolase family 140 protein [Flexithrix dorotheae]|uniref:glycoside hydrolase family 140 protein n=1 Tax=Flexithrix dorotheae TaxID=70993 RepID=UPI00036A2321|nr:glycoside hydrolase family 140 protein [Flexithrix dorotheae]
MKTIFLFFCLFFINLNVHFAQRLVVNAETNKLEYANGKQFVWIGDTAWELFHKLDEKEAQYYLKNRAEKGFTVIQAVVLAENNGLRAPNSYGHVPFENLDPTKPNESYFEHVDFIVNQAEKLGLFIAILPTWGDKVYSENPGAGPIIFNKENAKVFGEFLGKRYKDKPIIWILGGDRNIANEEVLEIWRAMAKGLKNGDQGKHLISYHPRGGSVSSYWLHNENWLDFNMYQSGHEKPFNGVYKYAEKLQFLNPKKPFVEGEPAYEDIPVRFWDFMDFSQYSDKRVPSGTLSADGIIKNRAHFKAGFFTGYDSRVFAYWNLLSGTAGYTYGNNAVWQMFKKRGEIAIPCLTDWKEALDRPGAADMQHVRDLFESRPLSKLIPDQSIIYGKNPEDKNHLRAAGSTDESFALIYAAVGQEITLVMGKVKGDQIKAWWYNPRNGETKSIGEMENKGIKKFTPPTTGEENDWLLVLDELAAGYDEPGKWEK